MGSSSSSQANPSTNDYSNSFNKTVTSTLGAGAVGLTTGDVSGSLGNLSYASNSNNTTTDYNLGAGSTSSATSAGSGTPFDLSSLLPYLLIAAALVFFFILTKK